MRIRTRAAGREEGGSQGAQSAALRGAAIVRSHQQALEHFVHGSGAVGSIGESSPTGCGPQLSCDSCRCAATVQW